MTADQGKLIQISDIQTLMKDSHFVCMCKLLEGAVCGQMSKIGGCVNE